MRTHVLAGLLALVGLLAGQPAQAASPTDALVCLRQADLACARKVGDALVAKDPHGVDTLKVEAWTAFHEGRYEDAVAALDELMVLGVDLEAEDDRTPYRETAKAAGGFVSLEEPGYLVRHAPGVDTILGEDAADTLAQARRTYDRLLGGGPPHRIVLDLFPTASRFIAASGLPPEAVQTTGVVALSKWTRLLVTSPRALARGYGWKDTVCHEYIHLVVAWRTRDQTPVWLQEGLAKHLESYWRGDRSGGLSAWQQSLLADALHHDSFVPFEKFKHSMAYLDSGEEAALAFAQVSTMIQFLIASDSEEVLPRVLDRVRGGEDAQQVVAEEAGFSDWEAFRGGWMAWLRTLPLVEQRLAGLPVVLDGGGDEFATDPLLAQRQDLRRYARVGDLLRDAGRPKAALIEYEKVTDPTGPPSPMMLSRKASCLDQLGDHTRALALVDEGVALYPEFTLLQVTRGRLLDTLGRRAEAITAWSAAHDLNPYDPEVQRALTMDFQAVGDEAASRRHLRYARILASGGALTDG